MPFSIDTICFLARLVERHVGFKIVFPIELWVPNQAATILVSVEIKEGGCVFLRWVEKLYLQVAKNFISFLQLLYGSHKSVGLLKNLVA